MAWSPNPTAPQRQSGGRWSPNPTAPQRSLSGRWRWMPRAYVTESAVGADRAMVPSLALTAADRALAADVSRCGIRVSAVGAAVSADRLVVRPRVSPFDAAMAADAARLGVRPSEAGVSADSTLVRLRANVLGSAVAQGLAVVQAVRLPGVAMSGVAGDSALAGFTPHAEATLSFTAVGQAVYVIPVWCRFVDVVLLGAGGGGASSGIAYLLGGFPGEAGKYATVTLERGVDIPWATTQIVITISSGGSRGSGGFTGNPGGKGGNTLASAAGWAGLTGVGGDGGVTSATGTPDNAGISPGDLTYNGRAYKGGGSAGTGKPGDPPGGGGGGGGSFGQAAGVGASGAAWCRAYQ